ncbi:hypothetical protein BC567DRAFT_223477 [Phyllosticta citribraziliensis]
MPPDEFDYIFGTLKDEFQAQDNGPVENGPVDNGPIDNGPVDNGPVDNDPVENKPASDDDASTDGQTYNPSIPDGDSRDWFS